ncbi:MAG TPA: DUF2490 domain-containing protein [Cytophagaceae bacterium]|jgi:hypothetical protein|nr:DUF2490 domain-containing protein [Cytophagaceae bacterium]
MRFHQTLLCFILVVFSFKVNAQSSYFAGVFPTIDHSGRLSQKLTYSLYYFAAFPLVNLQKPDVSKDAFFNLLYFEQALSYQLTNKLSLTGSYVYQRSNVSASDYVNENRFYVQATYKNSYKNINIKNRLRFDGRFIQNRATGETPFTNRLRYLIGIDFPIKNKIYFAAYEEAFFNTYSGTSTVYGENWAYAGFGKKINTIHKVELGLLYITWNTGDTNWFNQYYLQLTWISQLDLRKNKP